MYIGSLLIKKKNFHNNEQEQEIHTILSHVPVI